MYRGFRRSAGCAGVYPPPPLNNLTIPQYLPRHPATTQSHLPQPSPTPNEASQHCPQPTPPPLFISALSTLNYMPKHFSSAPTTTNPTDLTANLKCDTHSDSSQLSSAAATATFTFDSPQQPSLTPKSPQQSAIQPSPTPSTTLNNPKPLTTQPPPPPARTQLCPATTERSRPQNSRLNFHPRTLSTPRTNHLGPTQP